MSKAKINFLFAAPEPLPNGKYRLQVIAFNANDRKLAESSSDIKSTVTGGAEPAPPTK